MHRRDFIVLGGATAMAVLGPGHVTATEVQGMYGLIGKIIANPGKRDELISILVDGVAGMPGCLSYVVARDGTDDNAIWVTEVWDSKESHEASLSFPSVQDAIRKGRPLIAGFDQRFETEPVGGIGLDPVASPGS